MRGGVTSHRQLLRRQRAAALRSALNGEVSEAAAVAVVAHFDAARRLLGDDTINSSSHVALLGLVDETTRVADWRLDLLVLCFVHFGFYSLVRPLLNDFDLDR